MKIILIFQKLEVMIIHLSDAVVCLIQQILLFENYALFNTSFIIFIHVSCWIYLLRLKLYTSPVSIQKNVSVQQG